MIFIEKLLRILSSFEKSKQFN